MSERINKLRLLSSPFVRDNSDMRNVYPVIVLSCEGTKTEYQYFYQLAKTIVDRKYPHTDVVVKLLPLPKMDTNSDPMSVFMLLDEFWFNYGKEYDSPIMAAVIDRDDHDYNAAIEYCQNHEPYQIQLFLSSPCFEFFLLLHLCDDIKGSYDMDKIKENNKISDKHTYVSKLISDLTHCRKGINFENNYLYNIPRAIKNAEQFEMDIKRIGASVGTNLPYLFEMMSGTRETMWE